MKARTIIASAISLAYFACLTASQAAFNGGPVGGSGYASDFVANDRWSSTLNPYTAINQPSCPWIANGLTAQGFTAGNGWTINYSNLAGGLTLTKYVAWVTAQPIET